MLNGTVPIETVVFKAIKDTVSGTFDCTVAVNIFNTKQPLTIVGFSVHIASHGS
jgi:hypothetical protein